MVVQLKTASVRQPAGSTSQTQLTSKADLRCSLRVRQKKTLSTSILMKVEADASYQNSVHFHKQFEMENHVHGQPEVRNTFSGSMLSK